MRRISTSRYVCAGIALTMVTLIVSLPGCGAIDVEGILGENTCLILNCDGVLFIGEAGDGHDDMDDMDGMDDEHEEEDGHDDMEEMEEMDQESEGMEDEHEDDGHSAG